MFNIVELSSYVKVQPWDFHGNLAETCQLDLNKKLANKVLHNVGLMLFCREIVSFGDSFCAVKANDGSSTIELTFRFVAFRPEIGSTLTGKVSSCEKAGIRVTLGFFDDIFIPESRLQYPSRFDETENAWIWEYDLGNGETHDLFIDEGESVKFRVFDEQFFEHEPNNPVEPPGNKRETDHSAPVPVAKPSYVILGSMNECGLGVESWWSQNNNNEDDK